MRSLCRSGAGLRRSDVSDRRSRHAVVVVELIVMLPVLLVFLAAMVEFGFILANTKVVALASRTGARIAAETPSGSLPASLPTIRTAVNSVLATGGMNACTIILEYNVGGPPSTTLTDVIAACNCSAPGSPALPTANGGAVRAVRVTVCVPLSQLTPNLLGPFGFSTANRTARESTLYPYEQ